LIAIKRVLIQDPNGIYKSPLEISEVLLIQCKNLKVEKPLSPKEKNALKKLAEQTGGKPLHVYNNIKHKIVVEEIT
jgi:hypothetical protein